MPGRVALRRVEDRINEELAHHSRVRTATAFTMGVCGGLAVLYLFFALVATIDVGSAIAATGVAAALAALWLVGAVHRARTGAARIQRHDRERRGF